MTRKDYVLIAEALRYSLPLNSAQHNVCHALAADNARFDKARFLKACGVLS